MTTMFASLTLTRSRSSSSSTTSTDSSYMPPTTLLPFFSTPLKSSPSPPRTTTSFNNDYFSLSPPLSAGSFYPGSPNLSTSTAYPSWPNRTSLAVQIVDCSSPSHSTPGFNYEEVSYSSSRISDEDLLGLEGWGLPNRDGELVDEDGLVIGPGISWSETRQPEVVVGEERRRRNRAPLPVLRKTRDRSRSVKRKGRGLAVIAE